MNQGNDPLTSTGSSPLGRISAHESAIAHVTGRAQYVDDIPLPKGALVGWPICSDVACGRIVMLDISDAQAMNGVWIFTASDIPGQNDASPLAHDEPLLACLLYTSPSPRDS